MTSGIAEPLRSNEGPTDSGRRIDAPHTLRPAFEKRYQGAASWHGQTEVGSGSKSKPFRARNTCDKTNSTSIETPFLHKQLRTSVIHPPKSRTEFEAVPAHSMSPERSAVLGTLLASTSPSTYKFHELLQPIWANETMHRAYTMVCLVKRLEELLPVAYLRPSVVAAELTLAKELSALFTALSYSDAKASASCSEVLRETVRDVVELFGPIDGQVTLKTQIETMILPAFQSRALVLLAQHLVLNALRYGLHAPEGGHIDVTLFRVDDRTAQLTVADSGEGFVGLLPSSCSVVHDLASLLEAVPKYSPPIIGGATVTVKFAIHFEAARPYEKWSARNPTRCD
jgi:hypothetical protein